MSSKGASDKDGSGTSSDEGPAIEGIALGPEANVAAADPERSVVGEVRENGLNGLGHSAQGRDPTANIDDYRMPDGIEEIMEARAADEPKPEGREVSDEEREWFEEQAREESIGYKRPPSSGRIKKGEVRNPYGRRGKRSRELSLAESGKLPLIIADRLNRKIPVKSGGTVRMVPTMEVIADKMMRDLLGECPKARIAALKQMKEYHIFDALVAHEEFREEIAQERAKDRGWSDELEAKFQAIEAEFSGMSEHDSLEQWLRQENPSLLAKYEQYLKSEEAGRKAAPTSYDGWGGYVEQRGERTDPPIA